jgi:hypothetical protein
MQSKDDNFTTLINVVRTNWVILAAMAGTVAFAFNLQISIAAVKNDIKTISTRQDDQLKILIDFGNSGAAIKRDLININGNVEALKQENKDFRTFYFKNP